MSQIPNCYKRVFELLYERILMQKDLISIIIPVYNVEEYLDRCIQSVLHQTYQTLEIILVDDGSTDHSGQMCDVYAKSDKRIKVVHKPNGGLSDARNAGLKVATGIYIGYVDSDDWIELDMYERMYTACVDNQAELAICRYVTEYSTKDFNPTTSNVESNQVVPLSREALLKIYICGHDQYVIYNSVWSKLFHKDLVKDMFFPKGRNSEDIMYTTKAFCKLKKAVYMDTGFYHYVQDRQGSIMNVTKSERMFRDEIPFWRAHISYIRTNVSETMGDLAAYYFWRRLLSYYLDLSACQKTRTDAKRLAKMMRSEKVAIRQVYAKVHRSKGDLFRMSMFLRSPLGYCIANRVYARIIVPIKRKAKGQKEVFLSE